MGQKRSAAGGHRVWLHGLKIAAVAVVAQAVWGMAQTLCPDRERRTLATLAAVVVLIWPTAWGQIAAIAIGALAGMLLPSRAPHRPIQPSPSRLDERSRRAVCSSLRLC